jgi:hypothetical protein
LPSSRWVIPWKRWWLQWTKFNGCCSSTVDVHELPWKKLGLWWISVMAAVNQMADAVYQMVIVIDKRVVGIKEMAVVADENG